MARAGLAVAVAPHARRIWLACGPGNNGGDGLEAAMHLQHWGKQPVVTWLGSPDQAPHDAATAYQHAVDAGVSFAEIPPLGHDLCIDALLGIGAQRTPEGRMAEWITLMNTRTALVLAVNVPSGLQADTGVALQHSVQAQYTLSLLTLKPGLFTAHGRDVTGTVWLDDLGVMHPTMANLELTVPSVWLAGAPHPTPRRHASHKGSFGDVAVVGGAPGMTGAALLAASAALHAGAGRVFVGLLDGGSLSVDTQQPELMFRAPQTLDFPTMTVVCGCGGGNAVRTLLPQIISTAKRLLLDADALNALATDTSLQTLLSARARRTAATVITPHPLEAARLLGIPVSQVQDGRLAAAQELARRFECTVVLKGSGSILTAPRQTAHINPTGNARLASAGTGDVLAGMIGARLAAGSPALQAACYAVYQHGLLADQWPLDHPFSAGMLSGALRQR